MIYLVNAATSFPKAPGVEEAMVSCLREVVGNPGRASHRGARAARPRLLVLTATGAN